MINRTSELRAWLEGYVVDVVSGQIFPARVSYGGGRITKIERIAKAVERFILPPFVDAHVHIESSMLSPAVFASMAVVHGTGATVSDPHEITNVLGLEGIRWMIENGKAVPFTFCFGAPPCVPATIFETAGARLGIDEVRTLLEWPEIGYLAEVMNFPGVLNGDPELLAMLAAAKHFKKPIDGHAPGLMGMEAQRYAEAGPSTDHECFTAAEALGKIAAGMKILIREGSAAKNFDALIELMKLYPAEMMFCSDDKHPDDLLRGHINQLVRRAVHFGIPAIDAIRAATLNPVRHYGLNLGLLQEGDPADFIIVNNLTDFNVQATFLRGEKVAEAGKSLISAPIPAVINNFSRRPIDVETLRVSASGTTIRVIEAIPGELVTRAISFQASIIDGQVVSNVGTDVLKLVVVNRYASDAAPAIGFVHNFGLRRGALASSVAHDSHNIVAVGVDDDEIAAAVNLVIKHQGGIAAVSGIEQYVLPLPIAGLMSILPAAEVAECYEKLDHAAKAWGSALPAPFMTLSFLALPVIPDLKLTDKGLFDVRAFAPTSLFV